MKEGLPLLPPALASHPEAARLTALFISVRGCGAALRSVAGRERQGVEIGGQLKTLIDRAAEGWVMGYLTAACPRDPFLAEERYDATGGRWSPHSTYFTVDALDGTRSYIDGYPGYCVQAAYIRDGAPLLAAIDEPAFDRTWISAAGHGAHLLTEAGWTRLLPRSLPDYPAEPRFVDSTPPGGAVGRVLKERGGRFIEHGSIGAKALRVADGAADIFAKDLRFKLWDVAPADLILRETGCRLGTWDGAPIDYTSERVVLKGLLAAPEGLYQRVAGDLTPPSP